jgi:hypothetical protein
MVKYGSFCLSASLVSLIKRLSWLVSVYDEIMIGLVYQTGFPLIHKKCYVLAIFDHFRG